MRVRKFYANSMPEAMAQIKAELGPEAVILHTEEKNSRGLLKFFRRARLEVTAAVDTDLRDFPVPAPAAGEDIKRLQHEVSTLKVALSQVTEKQQSEANGQKARRMSVEHTALPRIASLDGWYQRLLDKGVGARLAQQIIQSVADELSRWALDNESVLNEHLHWHLGRRLIPPAPLVLGPGQPQHYFVVGPTGVGKTTTIAKLAANFKHSHHASVLMITADTFRVAAIPQMKTFGEVLDIPTEVAYSPAQLAELVQANRHYDLILIDMPGRNHRVAEEITELNDFLAVIPRKIVNLAIAAGTQYQDMVHIVESFGAMPLNGFIFTKTDETMSIGPAYTLACEKQVPLSYLTTGQHVPEDIEVASAERVVDLLVGPVPDRLRSIGGSQVVRQKSVADYAILKGEI